jgi:PAS domain S-box-containing protein
VSCSFVPLRNPQREVVGMVVSCTDVTERRRAEAELAHQHNLLRSLVNTVPDLIFYKDEQGRYVGCNHAFEAFSGRRAAELVGRTDAELFPDAEQPIWRDLEREIRARRQPGRHEDWLRYPDGRRMLVEMLLTPLLGDGREVRGWIGIGRDLTERKRMEDQLRQAGKMEAIGQLAGGVAHDFNNLLTIILGNLSLALNLVPEGDAARGLMAFSEQAATRAAQLTSQLLGFARRTTLHVESIDLNKAVTETVALLRHTIDPRIAIDTRGGADLWAVEVDPGQMNQVLVNLCLNARDAMPDGGRLRIETENCTFDDAVRRMNLEARPGEYVRLRVSDTGVGMDAETRARIFEPFFTTKGLGQGTGLGLAMVFGIVRSHGGWIDCYSEVGQGTRFDVYLPRSRAAAAAAVVLPPRPAGGRETVLVVDDEPMIRNLARTVLASYGYQTLQAEDGQEAVEIFEREHEGVDLVLMDLTMPRLSGQDAFQEMRRIDPRVRVLFASGYSSEHVAVPNQQGVLGFISKPYRPHELAAAVRAALDEDGPAGRGVADLAVAKTP